MAVKDRQLRGQNWVKTLHTRSRVRLAAPGLFIAAGLLYVAYEQRNTGLHRESAAGQRSSAPVSASDMPIAQRGDIASYLEEKKFTTGIELGVQHGAFAAHNLNNWPSCQQYHLVDLWAPLDNYVDFANKDQQEQDQIYDTAMENVKPWKEKIKVHRGLTLDAAPSFSDGSIDFVYVDARHDYCGCMDDMAAYWPKVARGGLMAGHDYIDSTQLKMMTPEQNWSTCADGSVHEGSVRQAVNDFAERNGVGVSVTYWQESWPSWLIRKP